MQSRIEGWRAGTFPSIIRVKNLSPGRVIGRRLSGEGETQTHGNNETDGTTGMDGTYGRVMRILLDVLDTVDRNDITVDEFLPALVDFAAAFAYGAGGQEYLRVMHRRIGEWRTPRKTGDKHSKKSGASEGRHKRI